MHSFRWALATPASTAAGDHGNDVGEQGHLAGALDRVRDVVLMLRASAGYATRLNLAAIGGVLAKELDVLVVDLLDALLAELAVLATRLALKILLLLSHVDAFLWTDGSPSPLLKMECPRRTHQPEEALPRPDVAGRVPVEVAGHSPDWVEAKRKAQGR